MILKLEKSKKVCVNKILKCIFINMNIIVTNEKHNKYILFIRNYFGKLSTYLSFTAYKYNVFFTIIILILEKSLFCEYKGTCIFFIYILKHLLFFTNL